MTDVETEIARTTEEISAAPEEVFDALLDPEALAGWFRAPNGGSTQDWEVDPVPGGAWRARTVAPDGTPGTIAGEIVTIDAPRLLELRWRRLPGELSESTVRFDLEPAWHDGARVTRVTVTHVAQAPLAARALVQGELSFAGHDEGAALPYRIVGALCRYIASVVVA